MPSVNNRFEVGSTIDRQRQVVRAGVELLAHDSNQKIQNYSKGGPYDRHQCYTTRQQAGSRQECDPSVSGECAGSGTDRLAPAYRRNTLAGAGNRHGLFARRATRLHSSARAVLGDRLQLAEVRGATEL